MKERLRVCAALALGAVLCASGLASCGQDVDSHVAELPASSAEGTAPPSPSSSDGATTQGSAAGSSGVDTTGAAKEYAATVEHIYSTEFDPEAGYRHATPEEAAELIAQEGSILVDVRGKVDWDYMHIPGSVPIAFNVITGNEGRDKLPNKDQLIILYCDYGGMSKIAAEDLVYAGYTNVVEFNGLEVWDGPVEGLFLYEEGAPSVQGKEAAAESGTGSGAESAAGAGAASSAEPGAEAASSAAMSAEGR
ncbi:MAG: rhodanese-like domain-containing protein [Eggerthellaceae bacterium]|nr:rhodanese-like domain-containing protein [Eggerthellaceae bacterium]